MALFGVCIRPGRAQTYASLPLPPLCVPFAGDLCYTVCTMTCYSNELGSNYSRIAPTYPEQLGEGGLVSSPFCVLCCFRAAVHVSSLRPRAGAATAEPCAWPFLSDDRAPSRKGRVLETGCPGPFFEIASAMMMRGGWGKDAG